MQVRITKLRGSSTSKWGDYKFGAPDNEAGLPDKYIAEGELMSPMKVGERIRIHRYRRSDEQGIVIESEGVFTSSPIKAITTREGGVVVETKNSNYLVEYMS